MEKYTFLTITTEEVMDVPGEIIETHTNRPFNSEQFVALVKLDETETEDSREVDEQAHVSEYDTDDSEGVDPVPVDFEEIDGVGESTAKNLANTGIKNERDVRAVSTDELEEVNGVGPSTAENIKEYVENE